MRHYHHSVNHCRGFIVQQSILMDVSRVTFSKRELEIAQLCAQGLENSAIAEQLCISEGTLANYLTGIYSKLKIPSGYNRRAMVVRAFAIAECIAIIQEAK